MSFDAAARDAISGKKSLTTKSPLNYTNATLIANGTYDYDATTLNETIDFLIDLDAYQFSYAGTPYLISGSMYYYYNYDATNATNLTTYMGSATFGNQIVTSDVTVGYNYSNATYNFSGPVTVNGTLFDINSCNFSK